MIIGKDDEGQIVLMASEHGLEPLLRDAKGVWGPCNVTGYELGEFFSEVHDEAEREALLAEALKQKTQRKAFSVSAYVKYQDKVLLVNHKKQAAWVPIGGEIEANETPREALVREVFEEIGWKEGEHYDLADVGPPLSPRGLLAYEEHDARSKGWHMNFAFLLIAKTDDLTPCNEFTEIAWVSSPTDKSPIPPNVFQIVHWALCDDDWAMDSDDGS